MTQFDDQAGEPAAAQAEALQVRVARELLERARAEGVSLVGPGGLLAGVTKTVLQAALDAEMADHLGYEKGQRPPFPVGNHRNGTSPKTVLTEVGAIGLEVPRDRAGKFEPQIVPKHARRVEGFNEAIVSLYAKGLTTGEIRAHLGEIYGVEVSRDLISRVTDRVAEELAAWQSRPLDRIYPVVLIDAIFVKIREGHVANRPIYVALGINCAGERDVLGLWAGTGGEGAKAWMATLAELRNRGVEDVCIVACDGLKGLPEAISEIWPQATVQLCVVHPHAPFRSRRTRASRYQASSANVRRLVYRGCRTPRAEVDWALVRIGPFPHKGSTAPSIEWVGTTRVPRRRHPDPARAFTALVSCRTPASAIQKSLGLVLPGVPTAATTMLSVTGISRGRFRASSLLTRVSRTPGSSSRRGRPSAEARLRAIDPADRGMPASPLR